MKDEAIPWSDIKAERKRVRSLLGVPCPVCIRLLPKANPTILLPRQRCRIHGYLDPRAREQS